MLALLHISVTDTLKSVTFVLATKITHLKGVKMQESLMIMNKLYLHHFNANILH